MEWRGGCRAALSLLRRGLSDEAVELQTRLPLLTIIELRAHLASAPASRGATEPEARLGRGWPEETGSALSRGSDHQAF